MTAVVFNSNRIPSSRARRGKRPLARAPRWLALASLCGVTLACSASTDGSRPVEDVAQRSAALDPAVQNVVAGVKLIIAKGDWLAGGFSKVKSAVEGAEAILTFLGVIDAGPSVTDQLNALSAQIDKVASALDWKENELAWNDDVYAPVATALMEAHKYDVSTGNTMPSGAGSDHDSQMATVAAGGLVMFERLYLEKITDGPWKDIITDNKPEIIGNDQVFDWRLTLPRYVNIVAGRLAVMATVDPNFGDGSNVAELDGSDGVPGYGRTLTQHMARMIKGVHCDTKDRLVFSRDTYLYAHTDIACADVNTGIAFTTTQTIANYASCANPPPPPRNTRPWIYFDPTCVKNLPGQADVNLQLGSLRKAVLNQMPIFETQSLIDTLYRLAHPSNELADVTGNIEVEQSQGLCLQMNIEGGAAYPGTPVYLRNCDYSSYEQWWQYDRPTGRIVNLGYNMCLEVKPPGDVQFDDHQAGAVAQVGTCREDYPDADHPLPTHQRWTYDPASKAIMSAEGTFLDIQYGVLAERTPVWLWDFNGFASQQWHAD